MNPTSPISALLDAKGFQVHTVTPDWVVFDAIKLMADKNVGALVVVQEGRVVGVVSERDYTRKVVLKGKSSKDMQVAELLSSPVIHVGPEASVEECMRLMTTSRIRHLPVIRGEELAGIISIGDLVNWIISAQDTEIHHLKSYISGQYPG